jgi:EAL domain-containing protein (putative c-di-GMP-specific phosphodiesterase class I)/CheY-like chemotaxis protein
MPHRQHLLVVDDQRLDRAIATHAATQAGFAVSGAGSIEETRELLEAGSRFDFVVLDLSLGAEDGLEVLPLLARYTPSAVIVLASGFDGRIMAASQRVVASLGLQVAGFLRKPILPTALQRLLRQAPHVPARGRDDAQPIAVDQIAAAIADSQIRPWFQPKVSLATGAIIGAEALARWVRPDGRLVMPTDFVPIAEQGDHGRALTDAILDQALFACAAWRDRRPECHVAINLSPLLLDDPGLTDRIEAALRKHAVPSGALVVEITESNGIPDTARTIEALTRLRIRGVNLAVDDFGTGHSSLLSLVRMPFNEMKIDQAFVRDAVVNRDARKVVRASASLGRELGLKVVAEGVESEAIAQLAGDAGCDVGQGWLYGPAVPQDIFQAALDQAALDKAPLDKAPLAETPAPASAESLA